MSKLLIASQNLNGVTREKVKKCIEFIFSNHGKFPDIFLCQETKTLCPPIIQGFNVVSNLDQAVHGCCSYIKSNLSYKVEYSDQNSICLLVRSLEGSFLVCNGYNPYSSKENWRDLFGSVFEICLSKNLPIIFGIDLNFNLDSPEYEDFENTALGGLKNNLDRSQAISCRDVSSPDHLIATHLKGKVYVEKSVSKTDHLMLRCSVTMPSSLLHKNGQSFYCKNISDSPNLISLIWSSIDIESISKKATDANSFFLNLELSLRCLCIEHELFLSSPTISTQISASLRNKLSNSLKRSPHQHNKLKEISSYLNSSGSAFTFFEISEAIQKAEDLPIAAELSRIFSRRCRSFSPLVFSFSEVWSVINSLNTSKSSGPVFLSSSFLKRMPAHGVRLLCSWFSRVSCFGYPDFFRIHKAIAETKSDGSCRPICVLSSVGKVYDILLMNRLEPILVSKLPVNQAAYIKYKRGAEDNLTVVKVLSLLFDDLILVLTDFSKAFNTVPNKTIFEALEKQGVTGTLLDAVFDSLLSFKICDFEAKHFSSFERGVKQGGVTSGIIFTSIMTSMSTELDSIPLLKPVFLGGRKCTHLIFADDVVLLARCLADAKALSKVVEGWSASHGLVLNQSKCKILPGYKSDSLWYSADITAKYLGVKIRHDEKGFSFTRQNTNQFYSFKLRPAIKQISDFSLFRNMIKIFNSGPYAHPIVSSEILSSSRSVSEVCDKTKSRDTHWGPLVKYFFSIPHKTILSHYRVTSELGLASARFGCSLVKYCSDYKSYILLQPNNSFVRLAYEAGTSFSKGLDNSAKFCDDLEFWPRKLETHSWLSCPRRERNLIASVVLSIYASDIGQYRALLYGYAANKEYASIRTLVSQLTRISG